MNNIGYSTVGFIDRDIDKALDVIAGIGFGYAEILGQEPHVAVPPKNTDLSAFRKRLEIRNLNSTVHAPLGVNTLGGPDEDWRQKAVRVLSDYIHFAGAINAEAVIIHPIPNPIFISDSNAEDLPARLITSARRSLDDLIPLAAESGVFLLLENLPYICNYPLRSMKELRELVDLYPTENVGLVLDTGHAAVLGDNPVDEIKTAGNRLLSLHLHDSDGKEDQHWAPGQGVLNWDSIISALHNNKYKGVLMFEATHGRSGETPEELATMCLNMAKTWSSAKS